MFSPIIKFFYGWYIDDSINFYNWFINFLKTLDRDIGLIGNLQNWTSPLYGDYSYTGIVVGPIFRTMRIFFGAFFYFAFISVSLTAYLFWIILPILVIAMMFLNLLILVKAPELVFALGKEMLKVFIR